MAAYSVNHVPNDSLEPDTWWGTGSVLASRWSRSIGSSLYCTTTSEGYQSNGALFAMSSSDAVIAEWHSALNFAVTGGKTYRFNTWAKWGDCPTAEGIKAWVEIYDNAYTPSLLQTTVLVSTTGNSSNEWVRLAGNITIPANGNVAKLFIGTYNAASGAWIIFDNVKMQAEDDTNMLISPSFENLDTTASSSLYPAFWRRNTSSPRFIWTTSFYNTGTASVLGQHYSGTSPSSGYRMWYNAQGATRSFLAVDPNRDYVFGGYMLWQDVTVGAVGIGIQWFDGIDTTINDTFSGADLTAPPNASIVLTGTSTTAWTYVVSTATPPEGARFARFILWNASTSTTVNQIAVWDDVYFDALPVTLTVSPSSTSCGIAYQQQFWASKGTAPYTWTSSDTTVGTIDANGLFTGAALGTTTITATDYDGYTGTATITVVPTSAPVFKDLFE